MGPDLDDRGVDKMDDTDKSKEQLVEELEGLRRQVAKLGSAETPRRQVIDKVRGEVRKMQHPSDIRNVLEEMKQGFRLLRR